MGLGDLFYDDDAFNAMAYAVNTEFPQRQFGRSPLAAMQEIMRGIPRADPGFAMPAQLVLSSEAFEAMREQGGAQSSDPAGYRQQIYGVPVLINDDMATTKTHLESNTPFCEFDDGDDWAVWAGMAKRVHTSEKVHAMAVNLMPKMLSKIEINVFGSLMEGRELQTRVTA